MKSEGKVKRIALAVMLAVSTVGASAQKPMTAPKGGKAISDELIGIFFEDISSSADGGLYAELLQNGSLSITLRRSMMVGTRYGVALHTPWTFAGIWTSRGLTHPSPQQLHVYMCESCGA